MEMMINSFWFKEAIKILEQYTIQDGYCKVCNNAVSDMGIGYKGHNLFCAVGRMIEIRDRL
jgi:hypothetical protein